MITPCLVHVRNLPIIPDPHIDPTHLRPKNKAQIVVAHFTTQPDNYLDSLRDSE